MRIKHKKEDVNEDGIELLLQDVSVIDDSEDVLYNPLLLDLNKAKVNSRTKYIVKLIQAKTNGLLHSYGNETDNGILSKYDNVKEEIGFQVSILNTNNEETSKKSEKLQSFSEKKNFPLLPKKRMRIIDLVEGESKTENFDKFLKKKVQKIPKFDEEDDYKDLETQINLTKKPLVQTTPLTEIGEEYSNTEDLFINMSTTKIDPKLSLKDTGHKSVVFVPLPTERLQNTIDTKIDTKDWLTKDRPLGRGLATCLTLLRDRKELGNIKAFGRNKDKVDSNEIPHYDSKGRILTKKQAFRMQCYSYHNQTLSQNKINKLQEKEETLLKVEKLDAAKGPESFRIAKDIMNKKQNPYVVISNLKKT